MELSVKLLVIAFTIIGWCSAVFAQGGPAQTLFTNVQVFDGVSAKLIKNAKVLVEGNLIKSVSTNPIDPVDATVIDGGVRTLMPGLIDAHVHISRVLSSPYAIFDTTPDYQAALTLV
jgi:adenine deaminase